MTTYLLNYLSKLKIHEKKFKGSRGHLGKISFVEGNLSVFKICEKKIQGLPQVLGKKIKGSRGRLGKISFGEGNFFRVFKILEKNQGFPQTLRKYQFCGGKICQSA